MYLSVHISLWFVVLAVFLVGAFGYFWGRSDERREWMKRLGKG